MQEGIVCMKDQERGISLFFGKKLINKFKNIRWNLEAKTIEAQKVFENFTKGI
jgi:hypothetical protein